MSILILGAVLLTFGIVCLVVAIAYLYFIVRLIKNQRHRLAVLLILAPTLVIGTMTGGMYALWYHPGDDDAEPMIAESPEGVAPELYPESPDSTTSDVTPTTDESTAESPTSPAAPLSPVE